MKTYLYLAAIFLLPFFLTQCSDAPNWGAETYNLTPPGAVSNPIVENINGGAIIHYTLPPEKDRDLLGVKALYSYHEGDEILEVYSSAYTDSVVLVGFPDTNERKVTLIALNKSRVESEPVEVTIRPLTPPIEVIRNSLITRETFSGVFVSWENPTRADIGISLYAEDSTGFMKLDNTYFTRESGQYSFRGFESEERKFRIEIKDRWNNRAIPLDTILTPIFEEDVVARDMSGRATWERYGYAGPGAGTTLWRGDYTSIYGSGDMWKMFDPVTTSKSYFHPGLWATFYVNIFTGRSEDALIEPKPMHFIIDMTRETMLSRCKVFFRNDGNGFNPNDPYHVSVYATNETPKGPDDFDNDKMASLAYWTTWPQVNGTGAWMDDWTHIGEFFFTPPSGATSAPLWTAEDKAWSRAGVDMEFFEEHSNTPFRYLRIVAHESIEGSQLVHFVRWDMFGSVVK